jgi:hypothetical protein
MKNMKAVITVRYSDSNEKSPSWGVVMERSFRTARMAMNYRDVLEAHGIHNHWFILEEVEDHLVGRWDGESL